MSLAHVSRNRSRPRFAACLPQPRRDVAPSVVVSRLLDRVAAKLAIARMLDTETASQRMLKFRTLIAHRATMRGNTVDFGDQKNRTIVAKLTSVQQRAFSLLATDSVKT